MYARYEKNTLYIQKDIADDRFNSNEIQVPYLTASEVMKYYLSKTSSDDDVPVNDPLSHQAENTWLS